MRKHIEIADGKLHLSAAAILMLSGEALNSPMASPAAKREAMSVIANFIAAAARAGFAKAQILETLLVKGVFGSRTLALCMEAASKVGDTAAIAAFNRAGFSCCMENPSDKLAK